VEIGIVGAGNIGSYYAGLLSGAGHSVKLVARGPHLDAIQARGLEVRTPDKKLVAHLEATVDAFAVADCGAVIVAVKSYSLEQVAPAVAAAARAGATILPLLNGVDVAERLAKLGVPGEAIVGGLVGVSVFRTAPGVVERRSPFDRVVIGEFDRRPSDRARRLVGAFADAGVAAELSADITMDLWRKFAFIVPMNVVCGLSRGPMGPVIASERGRELVAHSLHELAEVARAAGVPFSRDEEAKICHELLALGPGIRPSFLADLERGGPTELDLLAGTVSRLGQEHGVPTPVHDVATAAFAIATGQS
jgi:2-dehydropantoate 2-reductase